MSGLASRSIDGGDWSRQGRKLLMPATGSTTEVIYGPEPPARWQRRQRGGAASRHDGVARMIPPPPNVRAWQACGQTSTSDHAADVLGWHASDQRQSGGRPRDNPRLLLEKTYSLALQSHAQLLVVRLPATTRSISTHASKPGSNDPDTGTAGKETLLRSQPIRALSWSRRALRLRQDDASGPTCAAAAKAAGLPANRRQK
jgi:hypothetical protein